MGIKIFRLKKKRKGWVLISANMCFFNNKNRLASQVAGQPKLNFVILNLFHKKKIIYY